MPWLGDLRYACRLLARSPGFATAAVATLALAVGLNAFVFTLVNALLLRSLPVRSPHELVRLFGSAPGEALSHSQLSLSDLAALREEVQGLEEIAASALTTFALEDERRGRLVMGEVVTADYFETLGVEPARGRLLQRSDGRLEEAANPFGGSAVAVLSHTAWRRRFGEDPAVIGRSLRLNGKVFTVVGVAARGFFGLARGVSPEVWIPLGETKIRRQPEDPGRWLWLVGRRRAGAGLGEVEAEVATVLARLRQDAPQIYEGLDFRVVPARQVRILPDVDASLYPASFVGLGIVGLVLLVASSNLAHLLLARGLGRRREISTRSALGASRGALVRQLLAEGLVLSVAGGVLGLLFALFAGAVLELLPESLPVDVVFGLAVDWRVVSFTLGASVFTTLAFALAPALEVTRVDVATSLRLGGTEGSGHHRLRRVLVTTQIAVALLLLVAAGLAGRGLADAQRSPPGFEASGVVVASVAPRLQGYDEAQTEALLGQALEELRALPEIEAAAVASHLPLTVEALNERVRSGEEGLGAPSREVEWQRVDSALVGPEYFRAMGIPLLLGRAFQPGDRADGSPVAVINHTLAERLWRGQGALERTLRVQGRPQPVSVVGVAADGSYRILGEAPRPFLYLPFAQAWRDRHGHAGEITSGSQTLVVRTRGEPAEALAALRSTLRDLDKSLAISRLANLAEATGLALALPRVVALLFGVFAAVGLVLVAVGVTGVSAFTVRRRTREIGIRLALGAEGRDVLRLLLGRELAHVAVGIGLGLLLSVLATQALSSLVFGLVAPDLATLLVGSLFLAVLTLLASYLPARRAVRFDPQALLHWD